MSDMNANYWYDRWQAAVQRADEESTKAGAEIRRLTDELAHANSVIDAREKLVGQECRAWKEQVKKLNEDMEYYKRTLAKSIQVACNWCEKAKELEKQIGSDNKARICQSIFAKFLAGDRGRDFHEAVDAKTEFSDNVFTSFIKNGVAQEQIRQLEAELKKAKDVANLQVADAKVRYVADEWRKHCEKKDAEIKRLRTELQTRIDENDALVEEEQKLRVDIENWRKVVNNRNAEVKQLTDDLAASKESYCNLDTKLMEERSGADVLRKENTRLQQEWDLAHGCNETLCKEHLELKAQLNVLTEANKRLLSFREGLLKDLAKAQSERDEAIQRFRDRAWLERVNEKFDETDERDYCTDPMNCPRCKAFTQGDLKHAGIPLKS